MTGAGPGGVEKPGDRTRRAVCPHLVQFKASKERKATPFFFLPFLVLGLECRPSRMLGKHSSTALELHYSGGVSLGTKNTHGFLGPSLAFPSVSALIDLRGNACTATL